MAREDVEEVNGAIREVEERRGRLRREYLAACEELRLLRETHPCANRTGHTDVIMKLLRDKPGASSREIVAAVGVARVQVHQLIGPLIARGLVRREGRYRTARYYIGRAPMPRRASDDRSKADG